MKPPFWKQTPVLAAAAVFLFLAGGAGWWLISPLFISQRVEEAFPLTRGVALPKKMTRAEAETLMRAMSKLDTRMSEEMPAGAEAPQKLRAGMFQDADSFHKGSGQALIYRLPGGGHLLRLENFRVTNGPRLHVLLVRHPNPQKRAEVKEPGFVDLGRLKGNIGSQNYTLPPGVDPAAHGSVVIYCKPFQVIFSVATLR